MNIIVVSGMAGSGKSTALNALEDLGYYCVDNLPSQLIDPFVDFIVNSHSSSCSHFDREQRSRELTKEAKDVECVLPFDGRTIDVVGYAFGVNAFDSQLAQSVIDVKTKLSNLQLRDSPEDCDVEDCDVERWDVERWDVEIWFFDSMDYALEARFSQTRRPHPLQSCCDGDFGLSELIAVERGVVSAYRNIADCVIDTTSFSPHQLRGFIERKLEQEHELFIELSSFGFKYGLPTNADLVFDVRFLPNPYFIPELKEHTGLEKDVSSFVLSQPQTKELITHLKSLFSFLLPQYRKEGKRYLNIYFGCTGGKHRSVTLVEYFHQFFNDELGYKTSSGHRDS